MNKITYLDGARWHRALVAGANNVLSRQEYLNKINVFPVPDGDTGTNMVFTLTSILDSTAQKVYPRTDDMLAFVADAALDGARGNSGVILAQFFQGLSDGSAGIQKMTPKSFVKAIKCGVEYARQALATPIEGTILTVLTDFSNHLIKLIESQNYDFEDLLKMGINEAEKSLNNTPNLLSILKKAGVVDAGAQGFVDFLHGIFHFVEKGNLRNFQENLEKQDVNIDHINVEGDFANSEFRYCTECLINGENINHKKIREALQANGESLVIAGSKKKAKIHIHVNDPADVFIICKDFGKVSGEKADDMWKQQETVRKHKSNGIAIVTDSGADIPEDIKLDIHTVPVRYNFGNIGYVDKLSHTPEEFYHELSNNPNHPKTSQPTPGDFRRKYQYLQSHYDSIISIHLPHKLSGTYQSAINASKRVNDSTITIFDGLSASLGLGLIVMKAATLVKEGRNHNEIAESLSEIITSTDIFLVVKDLSYIVKGGRLAAWKKTIADFVHLRPILTVKDNGSMGVAGAIMGTTDLPKKMSKFVLKKMVAVKSYNVSIGHSNCLENGEKLMQLIQKNHSYINSIYLMDIGCALGVHSGPGSLAVSFQPA